MIMPIGLYIRIPNSAELEYIEVDENADVGVVRVTVSEILQCSCNCICLYFSESLLVDDCVQLSDIGLYSEAVIDCQFRIRKAIKEGGWWFKRHPSLSPSSDKPEKLTVSDRFVTSYNALWSQPLRAPDSVSIVSVAFLLSSKRRLDSRHMIGLIAEEHFTESAYFDSPPRNSTLITYELGGDLIIANSVFHTESSSTLPSLFGTVPVEIQLDGTERSCTVNVNNIPVITSAPVECWPSTELHPYVTLNADGDCVLPVWAN